MTIKTLIAELMELDADTHGEVWIKIGSGTHQVKMLEVDEDGDILITPGETPY